MHPKQMLDLLLAITGKRPAPRDYTESAKAIIILARVLCVGHRMRGDVVCLHCVARVILTLSMHDVAGCVEGSPFSLLGDDDGALLTALLDELAKDEGRSRDELAANVRLVRTPRGTEIVLTGDFS